MENLEPKDSLAIISAIISERQQKYEQNGLVFIFWGILIAVSGIVNFITKSPLVWGVLMPLSSVITSVYFYIKGRNNVKKRKSKDWVSFIWLVAGICAMLTGFSVSYHLIVGNLFDFLSIIIFTSLCGNRLVFYFGFFIDRNTFIFDTRVSVLF